MFLSLVRHGDISDLGMNFVVQVKTITASRVIYEWMYCGRNSTTLTSSPTRLLMGLSTKVSTSLVGWDNIPHDIYTVCVLLYLVVVWYQPISQYQGNALTVLSNKPQKSLLSHNAMIKSEKSTKKKQNKQTCILHDICDTKQSMMTSWIEALLDELVALKGRGYWWWFFFFFFLGGGGGG